MNNNVVSLGGTAVKGNLPKPVPKSEFHSAIDFKTYSPESIMKSATITSFYIANIYHDLMYRYGFVEASGNYQHSNYGLGGKEKDPIVIENLIFRDGTAYFKPSKDGDKGYVFLGSSQLASTIGSSFYSAAHYINVLIHGIYY